MVSDALLDFQQSQLYFASLLYFVFYILYRLYCTLLLLLFVTWKSSYVLTFGTVNLFAYLTWTGVLGQRAVAAVNEALDGDDSTATLRALNSPALQLTAIVEQTTTTTPHTSCFYHDELRCMRMEKQVIVQFSLC